MLLKRNLKCVSYCIDKINMVFGHDVGMDMVETVASRALIGKFMGMLVKNPYDPMDGHMLVKATRV